LKSLLAGIAKEKRTEDFKVVFDTDCNMLAKFELEHGGHDDVKDNLCYITVGTGVGIGLVINGKCVSGMIHPEGGHVSVPLHPDEKEKYNDFKGVCSFHGTCVEGLVSNVSIQKRLGLADVSAVADLSDDHEIWDLVGFYLGTMCANLYLSLSLQKIVIGGGVMKRGDPLFKRIRHHFKERIGGYLKHEKIDGDLSNFIVRSKFEDDLGLISSSAVGAQGEPWSEQGVKF
jgi:fructokinase